MPKLAFNPFTSKFDWIAKLAKEIIVEDTENHYATDNVEAALQEVGSLLGHFNGTFEEPFNALVTSNGTTITMSLEKAGGAGGDLTMRFSDGETLLDCTPACSIELTAGTDTIPADNYIYIPQSTKVLTKSTAGFPTDEHIKVSYFFVPSATYVASEGVYVNQNWNDERAGTSGQGHMSHITEKIRYSVGATYRSGLDLTPTIVTKAGALDDAYIATSSGVILQLHMQSIPAKDMATGSDAHVINDSVTPYKEISNLNQITLDADGDSISGRYFNILVAMAANKSGTYSPYLINLPTGSYVSKADALNDVDGYNVDALPDAFSKESSTGIYLYRLTMRKTTVNGGTLTFENIEDLRDSAGLGGGGSITPQTTFSDSQFGLFNVTTPTKTVSTDLSGITAGNNRTITMLDANMTIPTTTQHTDLTDGGDTTLHDHDGISENTSARHAQQHSITSTADHTSTATSGQILKADANGLPIDATNTDAEVSGHISSTANPHSVDIDDVTPTTTKGDIIVEDGSNAIRLAVGTNDQVLTADSGEASGVKWTEPQTTNAIIDGRLTLTSGTPVTGDVSGAGTVYYTPYLGNKIALYSGSIWEIVEFSELSLTLAGLTVGKNYDIWIYNNSGTATMDSTVWTNDTTRATAVVYQDGVLVKSGDATRRFVGTVRVDGGNVTYDSTIYRYLYNQYNKVRKKSITYNTTANWSYTSGIAIREYNNGTGQQRGNFIYGGVAPIEYDIGGYNYAKVTSGTPTMYSGVSLNSTTGFDCIWATAGSNYYIRVSPTGIFNPLIGFNYITQTEYCSGGNVIYYANSSYFGFAILEM